MKIKIMRIETKLRENNFKFRIKIKIEPEFREKNFKN